MEYQELPSFSVLTVTELTQAIKNQIESSFGQLIIKGEISNFKAHYSGHWYFTLKDENSQIPVVMWKARNARIGFMPKDGIEILAIGFLNVYEKGGRYQFDAEYLQVTAQKGDLFRRFEMLKEKLRDEGLFDDDQKKHLPPFPENIVLVTSSTGAALQDMLNIFNRRFPAIQLYLLSVSVQGDYAAGEIVSAIEQANSLKNFDLIILARGGGSIEDLWPFNEETVARAIFKSIIPVVTGIGHETDFTIADFVADYRAPTPSAAAEAVSPDRLELNRHIQNQTNKLIHSIRQLTKNLQNIVHDYDDHLHRLSPVNFINQKKQQLDDYYDRLVSQSKIHFIRNRDRLKAAENLLQSLNPNAILSRGYAMVKKEDKIISSAQELNVDERIKILFKDGERGAKITGDSDE